jgi:hypothetical protein
LDEGSGLTRRQGDEWLDSGQDEAEGGSQKGQRDTLATYGTLKIADLDVLNPVGSQWALIAEMDKGLRTL